MNTAIVCGGRDWSPSPRQAAEVERWLVLWLWRLDVSAVIHGDAPGADRWCAEVIWRRRPDVRVLEEPAKWHVYGKPAGPIRNRGMIVRARGLGELVGVLALPGGSGTADMCTAARAAGVDVVTFVTRRATGAR